MINPNKGKVILPNGQQIKVTTIARDLAKRLGLTAPIKQGEKLIDYQTMLTTAYLEEFQKTGTVGGGVVGMKKEYKRIEKLHKYLIRKQKGSWLRRLFKKKEVAVKKPVLKVVK